MADEAAWSPSSAAQVPFEMPPQVEAEAACTRVSTWGMDPPPCFRRVSQGEFLAQYTRPSKIGTGCIGRVYAAKCGGTGSQVAVRIASRNSDDCDRMQREAQLLAHIGTHPNVVELQDAVCVPGVAMMIVLQLFHRTLLEHIRKTFRRAPSSKFVVRLQQQLQRGLAYIHHRGCLHRGLSSATVLLKGDMNSVDAWTAAIADFEQGCVSTGHTVEAWAHHTPCPVTRLPYRAPELIPWRGQPYGAAVDVWSLGCVVADTLVGDVAFEVAVTESSAENQYLKRVFGFLGVKPPASVVPHWEESSFVLSSRYESCRFSYAKAGLPEDSRALWLKMLQIDPNLRILSRDFPASKPRST